MSLDRNSAIINLKQCCLRCWAEEYSDIFPRWIHTKIAAEELKAYGNPVCGCEPYGQAKKEYEYSQMRRKFYD